ncbi:DnaA regulatory inactivator Hda [Aquabacterium sp.]|uniref:HdaA/DnaA family protein n=1 Tax=Aquabacterium sp. TaxID=1872578 RepID=UPI0025C49B29|nr:DnaA regulatory inactivator Hda [Aquabacterium sp.]
MNQMDVFASAHPAAPMRQIPLDLGPVAVPGLDDFVAGQNTNLLTWLRQWPDVQGPLSPAYIWGSSGAGKTHLLRAMVERALGLGLGVIWLNAQTCQMWDAADPMSPTLALIDECEALSDEHQHLAFNLFIESASPSNPTETGPLYILAAGNVPPVDLPVRDDLRTRLGWGLIFALSGLAEDGVREALRLEAARRGMRLSDELSAYLLTRYSRDLGSLTQLLDRLDRYALAEHRLITVPLLKQMLAAESP